MVEYRVFHLPIFRSIENREFLRGLKQCYWDQQTRHCSLIFTSHGLLCVCVGGGHNMTKINWYCNNGVSTIHARTSVAIRFPRILWWVRRVSGGFVCELLIYSYFRNQRAVRKVGLFGTFFLLFLLDFFIEPGPGLGPAKTTLRKQEPQLWNIIMCSACTSMVCGGPRRGRRQAVSGSPTPNKPKVRARNAGLYIVHFDRLDHPPPPNPTPLTQNCAILRPLIRFFMQFTPVFLLFP